jgi:hypothetical protein
MLLPSATERANLRLKDCGQRLVWAILQLQAGLYANPAIKANTALGIKAVPAGKGMVLDSPTKPTTQFKNDVLISRIASAEAMQWSANALYFGGVELWMPLAPGLMAQGLDFGLCVQELSTERVIPLSNPATDGDPIPDNSVSTTVEQYLVEQYREFLANAQPIALEANFQVGDNALITGIADLAEDFRYRGIDYEQGWKTQNIPILKLFMPSIPTIPTARTATEVTEWETTKEGSNYSFNPYQYCSLGNYIAYRDALPITP